MIHDCSEIVDDNFKNWKIKFPAQRTVVGKGQTGLVTLASAYHVERPMDMFTVAVKCGDWMKMPSLKKELKNEARVMQYANNLGLKCVPKLYFSGYFGFGGLLYLNCSQYIDGYSKDLDKLTEQETILLKRALGELRQANIKHNDIRGSNVLFTSNECYILDYGYSEILEKDQTHLSLEYDLDEKI